MSDQLITTSSPEGLQALGSAAQRSWEMLTGLLREHLDPAAAQLLAEPVAARQGGLTEWYAPAAGRVLPLEALSANDQSALKAALGAQETRIHALADRLAAQNGEQGFWQAEALRNALRRPSDEDLWALQGPDGDLSPLLVNWSRLPDDSRSALGAFSMSAPRKVLPGVDAAPREGAADPRPPIAAPDLTAMAPPHRAPPAKWHWLLLAGWAALAVLIALILWLLLAPCAVRPLLPGYCLTGSRAALDPRPDLRAEIAMWEESLAARARDCRPAAPQALPGPETKAMQGAIDDLDRRLAERGARPKDTVILTISLVWSGHDDLDLHVQCPDGGVINWRNPRGACAAELDIDANYPPATAVDDPVENISFTEIRPGRYRITVERARDVAPIGPESFGVILRQDGKPDQTLTGTILQSDAPWAQEVEITP